MKPTPDSKRHATREPEPDHLGYLLTAYLFDNLSPAGKAEVEAHLESCAACREQLDALRATLALTEAAFDDEGKSNVFEDRRRQRILEAAARSRHGFLNRLDTSAFSFRSWKTMSAVAALLVLTVSFAVSLLMQPMYKSAMHSAPVNDDFSLKQVASGTAMYDAPALPETRGAQDFKSRTYSWDLKPAGGPGAAPSEPAPAAPAEPAEVYNFTVTGQTQTVAGGGGAAGGNAVEERIRQDAQRRPVAVTSAPPLPAKPATTPSSLPAQDDRAVGGTAANYFRIVPTPAPVPNSAPPRNQPASAVPSVAGGGAPVAAFKGKFGTEPDGTEAGYALVVKPEPKAAPMSPVEPLIALGVTPQGGPQSAQNSGGTPEQAASSPQPPSDSPSKESELRQERDRYLQELQKIRGIVIKQQQAIAIDRKDGGKTQQLEQELSEAKRKLADTATEKEQLKRDLERSTKRLESLIEKGVPVLSLLHEDPAETPQAIRSDPATAAVRTGPEARAKALERLQELGADMTIEEAKALRSDGAALDSLKQKVDELRSQVKTKAKKDSPAPAEEASVARLDKRLQDSTHLATVKDQKEELAQQSAQAAANAKAPKKLRTLNFFGGNLVKIDDERSPTKEESAAKAAPAATVDPAKPNALNVNKADDILARAELIDHFETTDKDRDETAVHAGEKLERGRMRSVYRDEYQKALQEVDEASVSTGKIIAYPPNWDKPAAPTQFAEDTPVRLGRVAKENVGTSELLAFREEKPKVEGALYHRGKIEEELNGRAIRYGEVTGFAGLDPNVLLGDFGDVRRLGAATGLVQPRNVEEDDEVVLFDPEGKRKVPAAKNPEATRNDSLYLEYPKGGGEAMREPVPEELEKLKVGYRNSTPVAGVELNIADVSDLTTTVQYFPGPRIDMGTSSGEPVVDNPQPGKPANGPKPLTLLRPRVDFNFPGQTDTYSGEQKGEVAAGDLVKVLKQRFAADFTDPSTAIEESGGKLVILNTPAVQQKINGYLEELRSAPEGEKRKWYESAFGAPALQQGVNQQQVAEGRREAANTEYKHHFDLNRERAGRMNIPHSDYLIYPDDSHDIAQRGTQAQERLGKPRLNELRGWNRAVSFDFDETPLEQAVATLREKTGADLVLDPKITEAQKKQPVTLRVKDMEASTALKWVAQLAELEIDTRHHVALLRGGGDGVSGETERTLRAFNFIRLQSTAAQTLGFSEFVRRPAPVAPPVLTDEGMDEDAYIEKYGTRPFVDAARDPLSTFGMDVDTASYTRTRSQLREDNLPDPAAVRVEEFVNYFKQPYTVNGEEAFGVFAEAAPSPFQNDIKTEAANASLQLLKIGIKSRDPKPGERKPAMLTFAIDTSGSMTRDDRLDLLRASLGALVEKLQPDDAVSIVAFSDQAQVVLPRTQARLKQRILDAIGALHSDGGTNVEAGLALAYRIADESYSPNAVNRVILCSDGVANVGAKGPDAVLKTVKVFAGRGIDLSSVGFGMGKYNDEMMVKLADNGNGSCHFVDSLDEARRIFSEQLPPNLGALARDAKVQVEFNPQVVARYRLLGYEKRKIADKDFRNDAIDAGEVQHSTLVTALYEIQRAPAARGTLGKVFLRWKDAGHRHLPVVERNFPLDESIQAASLESSSEQLRFLACVARFAELLRNSPWVRHSSYADVLEELDRLPADFKQRPEWKEVQELVSRAQKLSIKEWTKNL